MFNILSTTIAATLATAWIPVSTRPTFRLIRFFLYALLAFEPLPPLWEFGCPCGRVDLEAELLAPDPFLEADPVLDPDPFLPDDPLLDADPLRLPDDFWVVLELEVLLRLPSPEDPVPVALRFLRC